MCLCGRCHVVSQFNDGLYDIIIAADENSLDDPRTVKADSVTNKPKLVLHRLVDVFVLLHGGLARSVGHVVCMSSGISLTSISKILSVYSFIYC